MHRITAHHAAPLFSQAATRMLEARARSQLPPHTLMQRAGLAVAQLAMALAPHARTIWVACGPGNNGGDGFEAALQLHDQGFHSVVSWRGEAASLPEDALTSLTRLESAGIPLTPDPPAHWDLAIDAMLGLGSRRALSSDRLTATNSDHLGKWLQSMHASSAPVLAVDLPTFLEADTGRCTAPPLASTAPRHCLSLLTLKPGQFTAQGRDRCGTLWLDDLNAPHDHTQDVASAYLVSPPAPGTRAHATHKGSFGDVAVLGGAPGMVGAALLAATAALHAGAGRVFVGALDPTARGWNPSWPELMCRSPHDLPLPGQTVVAGCGGGDAMATWLPTLLAHHAPLVLDADALNALAAAPELQDGLRRRSQPCVITPHPLEAARLLGCDTLQVQGDRLNAARSLSQQLGCTVVLKGSGTVIVSPDHPPMINPTGNARLATAGTGDVLAGFIGAQLAQGLKAHQAACEAVWRHGMLADQWPGPQALTASALAQAW